MQDGVEPMVLNGIHLDPRAGTLTQNGAFVPLRARSFALLCHFARHAGQVLTKSDLLDQIWPDVTVTEDSLTQAVRDIRVALDDPEGTLLCTVRGRGYVLKPTVTKSLNAASVRSLRIAVLPFADTAVIEDTRPLISALVDDIAGGLARFRTLTVIARGSVEEASREIRDPMAIAARLGADYLVQGTARTGAAGLQLRLTLIDGPAGALVWSASFDCTGDKLLSVEADVTGRLVAHLNAGIEEEIEDRSARLPTSSLTAYGHFARGRGAMRANGQEGIKVARDHLVAAVEADPGFADAWALLAWAEMALHDYRMATPEVMERARSYARRAVELSPGESLTISTLGYIQALTNEFAAAEANISRGLRLNPSNVDAMMDMATLLLTRGRPSEALLWLDRAEDVNPLRYLHHAQAHRAEAMYMLGRYAEAAQQLTLITDLPSRRCLWMAAALAKSGQAVAAGPHLAAFAKAFPGRDPIDVARHSYNYEHEADSEHFLAGIYLALMAVSG